MSLYRVLKRYKRKLAKRFTEEIDRQQFNFRCDRYIVGFLRGLASQLEIPIYCLCEHALQLGCSELAVIVGDKALKDQLCRHLVRDHLLTRVTKPEKESLSRRVLRLKNAMNFLEILDTGRTPEQQRAILHKIMMEMQGRDNDDVSHKARSPGQAEL